MKLPSLPLLVLDTETTGFVPGVHRVIEYACAVTKDGALTREYEQLLSGGDNSIPPVVQVLTHILPADLAGKPTFADIKETLQEMLTPDMIIVGQNITFDLKMLKGEGWDITSVPWIDTSMLASLVFPELKSYSLGYVSEALGLSHEPKHRALGDVRATLALLGLCTERLESLPKKDLAVLQDLAKRGPESYKRFFLSLTSTSSARPQWLTGSRHSKPGADDVSIPASTLSFPVLPSPQLIEESLHPSTLSSLLAGAKQHSVIAVKNLDATLRRITLAEDVVILPSHDALLSMEAREKFLAQTIFTADELTLAMKLVLYTPVQKADFSIHGDEHALWSAKLAASAESAEYLARKSRIGKNTILTSHQELVLLASAEETILTPDISVIIDDASMLEDSATTGLGWTCLISTLRAAATGKDFLTACVDIIELWVEKTRAGMDLRYLAPSDLETRDVIDLHKTVMSVLETTLPHAAKSALQDLLRMLDPKNIIGRITWIESFMDGNKAIKSVPEKINELLLETLYTFAPTTLLIPKGASAECEAIVPRSVSAVTAALATLPPVECTIAIPSNFVVESIVTNASGKTVLLLSGKRAVEDFYVRYAEKCISLGITLLCQGFSGGQSRMQAEFILAKGPAILVTTPWTYETMEFPQGTLQQLILQTLPFDHPAHPVFSRRANRYQDPFTEYSLPRLKHRLFRLVRTFVRHAKKGGSILVIDDRLRSKQYGKAVSQYLLSLLPSNGAKQENEQLPLL